MKLPAIFFASAYGMIIPLPKTNALSYAEITLVYRNLFSAGKEITWKYGKLVPEDGSIISTHGISASPHGDMNKKPIFIVPADAEVRSPYKRAASLPGASFKSCAAKTSAHGKTTGKHDLTHISPCASTARKVLNILTFPFALAFLKSASQIIFGIDMTPSHNSRH